MMTAKVFQSGNSQAVRIPKEMQTTEKEFIIRKYADCYYLIPSSDPWALLKQVIGTFEDTEIPFERDQPGWEDVPEREAF